MEMKEIQARYSENTSYEQIQQLFEACGIIKSCVLSKGSDGKNSAVIEYTDPVHATAAVALSGTYLGDGMFTVSSQPPKPVAPSVAPGGIMPGMMLSGVVPSQPQQQVVPNVHMMQQQQQQAPTGGLSASAQSTQEALLAAQLKREEEISRTIYVGNLRPEISEDMLSDWLSKCGEVVCVKHCNNTVGEGENRVRYSFVEFKTREAAMTALGIGGSLLAGRPIKVGKALNPIIKNSKTLKKTAEVKKLPESSEIMQRVFQIKERLGTTNAIN
eukprot:jgi/Bigna1/131189/aug1.13_g5897